MKVLLTDGQQRKTLAMARSLGTRGITVLVAEETHFAPALFSRYCRKALLSPAPAACAERYFQWLIEVWERHHYDLLVLMDDPSLRAVMERRDRLPEGLLTLLPPTEGYQIAADKGLTLQQAAQAEVPCPSTLYPTDWGQVTDWTDDLSYPLIIKPRKSSGSRGIRLITEPEQLEPSYAEIHQDYPWPLIQECIPPGEKYDACLLYDRSSRLVAAFVQKEVRHFPLDNGPSTLQEGVHYPELIALADRLMQGLHWQGIAEVEFMIDPRDGVPKLMEINPRFWASLACAIFSGVDFPWLYYQLAIGRTLPSIQEYQAGQLCRWLLPGDLLHFLSNPRRLQMNPPLFSSGGKRPRDDILSWNDPWPTVGFLAACLRYLGDRRMWRLMFQR
jgi:predicted ATP-grasp superfamily ATP-dependent carboligase